MAEQTLGWLQKVLLPEVGELKGDVKALHPELTRVEGALSARIDAVGVKSDSLRNEVNSKF